MKRTNPLKQLLCLCSVFICSIAFSQDCSVDHASLKGTYTGECKKGKANGKGKAVGTDTYEGEFRAGLPDGQGTYTWSNGNTHAGKFVKGLREGKGIGVFKRTNASDSTVEGYWKNDNYIGKNEHPYKIYFTSKGFTQSEVEYKKDGLNQVTFFVTNTSGASMDLVGEETPRMVVNEIEMLKGSYARMMKNTNHAKKSETIVYDLVFPARMKVTIDTEQIDIEFLEPGNYSVDIRINQ